MKTGSNNYKGLNTDTGYDSIKDFYIDALDIRITTDKGESMGSITNIKGNKKFFELPIEPETVGIPEIIGTTSIRNTIILFVADDGGVNGWIYTLKYDESTKDFLSLDLKYTDKLNFKKENPIEAVGRYESFNIQRVYWVDYNNYFRGINIQNPNINNLPPGLLDIFPNVEYTEPKLTNILGTGNLVAGLYQYTYRIISEDGKKSLIAPPGPLIHCVKSSETESQSARYTGSPEGTQIKKSHEITIDTSEYSNFKDIELIVLIKENPNTTPDVYSIETKGINNQSEVSFVHSGNENSIIPLELSEVIAKQYPFKTGKTLIDKDNALIVANIKEGQFDIQEFIPDNESFNAKTKRYLRDGNTLPNPDTTEENKLLNAFNQDYNKDAHWDTNWHVNQQYKYKSDGQTLGGEGPNISYKFHLEPYVIDTDKQPGFINTPNIHLNSIDLNDGYIYDENTTYDNNASPFKSGLLRSHKRGEVYRYGIVFYNKKGEASFVEFIGDIKFPDISDETLEDTTGLGHNYFPLSLETNKNLPNSITTTAYALGIEFTIDFSTCPTLLNQIESYQIVRVKRKEKDTKRLCSGIVRVGQIMTAGDPVSFDLGAPTTGVNDDIIQLFPFQQTKDAVTGHNTSEEGYGWNGNFTTLNNTNTASPAIQGEFLTFYSPEISYRKNKIAENAASQGMLLMTGRYGQYFSTLDPDELTEVSAESDSIYSTMVDNNWFDKYSYNLVEDTDSEATEELGILVDLRRKMRSTGKVDKITSDSEYNTFERGVEYIKEWNSSNPIFFDNGGFEESDIDSKINLELGPYLNDGAFEIDYFRNFYSFLNVGGLNTDKTFDSGSLNVAILAKGASGVTGTIKSVETDPLNPNNTLSTVSPENYFRTKISDTQLAINVKPNSSGILGGTEEFENKTSTPIIDILIPKSEIYGGFTTDALENNSFIAASPVISKDNISQNSHTFRVLRGDTFISMWEFQAITACIGRRFYKPAATDEAFGNNLTETVSMPVETSLNLEIDHGSRPSRTVKKTVQGGNSGITETRWRQETENDKSDFAVTLDMYNYNFAYSLESDNLKFFIKPKALNENQSKVNDIRAFLSNIKFNNEELDSWTQFGINNFYDVDDYGPINKILAFNDSIFFIQDRAVGRYAINTRVSVPTGDGIPLELGTGQGIQDHKYLSNKSGSIHQWGVKETQSGIYYWDSINSKINLITQGVQPISEIKGIHSLVSHFGGDINLKKENGGDNPLLGKGVHIIRDSINNEVLFTFLGIGEGDSVKNITLVYDEIAQQFTSKYSATPNLYIENGDILLSNNPINKKELYQHNVGNWGEFYGNTAEASITLVLNANAPINKILRTVEFNSIVRDDNKVIERQQTITGFKIENEYQTTGKIDFSSGRIKRKFDKWRLKIPRDQNAGNNKHRLRSSHFKLTLYFDNTYNKELILNRILYYYDIQIF